MSKKKPTPAPQPVPETTPSGQVILTCTALADPATLCDSNVTGDVTHTDRLGLRTRPEADLVRCGEPAAVQVEAIDGDSRVQANLCPYCYDQARQPAAWPELGAVRIAGPVTIKVDRSLFNGPDSQRETRGVPARGSI